MNNDVIKVIEKKISYTFKNKTYLKRAFTHSSASRSATENYESLEFLGDSILSFVVAKRLMIENPNAHEGALTQRRSEIVSQEPLDAAIEKLGVARYLCVGKGESLKSIIGHTKVKSNLFEAIVGAIYLDSGDIDCAEKFILLALKDHFDGSAKHKEEHDYKSELNEFATRNKVEVKYSVVGTSGAPHDPTFVVDVLIDGLSAGRGKGKTKKSAQQYAAKIALEHISGR